MTATAWSIRFRAYLLAHGLDEEQAASVPASTIAEWAVAQARIFRDAPPDDLDFDSWLNERFPEPAEVAPERPPVQGEGF